MWDEDNRVCISQTKVMEGSDIISSHVKSWHHQKCCDVGTETNDETLKGACISDAMNNMDVTITYDSENKACL